METLETCLLLALVLSIPSAGPGSTVNLLYTKAQNLNLKTPLT